MLGMYRGDLCELNSVSQLSSLLGRSLEKSKKAAKTCWAPVRQHRLATCRKFDDRILLNLKIQANRVLQGTVRPDSAQQRRSIIHVLNTSQMHSTTHLCYVTANHVPFLCHYHGFEQRLV